jgi:hypothetical protein
MIPITTLKILDRHLKNSDNQKRIFPQKYTYAYEVLKQLRESILLEYEVQNKSWLN